MHSILREIFANFTRKHEPRPQRMSDAHTNKTDNENSDSNTMDPMEFVDASHVDQPDHTVASNLPNKDANIDVADQVENVQPKNIVTSVIKFAGRAPPSLITLPTFNNSPNEEPPVKEVSQSSVKVIEDNAPTQKSALHQSQQHTSNATSAATAATTTHGTHENDLDLASLNYKPLNYEPLPEMAPLPLINTNSNLSVYRQLLSPYLKKSEPVTRAVDVPNRAKQPSVIIDRPPKKMIEKYASFAEQ